ncbi:MAG TPA: Arm DNA-binding domain-containing protein, partial [Methylocella sp.]
MGRQSKRLTARTVASLKTPGRHADGDRLYLSIEKNGAGRRWVFLYALDGKQRELGLGSANVISLAQARARAAELRDMLAKGIDPFAAKRAAVEARKTARTFGECARELIASKRSAWRSKAHAGQWETTLATYCAALRDKPIDEIDTAAVLAVLKPIWQAVPETASRLRGRIEAVLDFGKA